MKLHELHKLEIKHEYLVDITLGKRNFDIRKNDRDYQVGDLINFVEVNEFGKVNMRGTGTIIDENALYRITCVLKDVPEYVAKDYCILGIKHVRIEE